MWTWKGALRHYLRQRRRSHPSQLLHDDRCSCFELFCLFHFVRFWNACGDLCGGEGREHHGNRALTNPADTRSLFRRSKWCGFAPCCDKAWRMYAVIKTSVAGNGPTRTRVKQVVNLTFIGRCCLVPTRSHISPKAFAFTARRSPRHSGLSMTAWRPASNSCERRWRSSTAWRLWWELFACLQRAAAVDCLPLLFYRFNCCLTKHFPSLLPALKGCLQI